MLQHNNTLHALLVTAPPLAMCFRCIARSLAQLEAEQKQTSLIVIGEAEMKLRALNWEESQLGGELNSTQLGRDSIS